jgi:uncharacterized protein YigA (DUF484 family)
MQIRDSFLSNVTRDIPPVVYLHEQSPEKLGSEVSEYIITGGWPAEHPNHRRVPNGIHEEYVRLLTNISSELQRPDGPDLPNAWISGFYGSGKSSFAKLLGLALDGIALPGGMSLAEAWLRRDTSPKAAELRSAWSALRQKVEPLAVVFDIGGSARDNEHIHAAAVRQVQRRLGYCSTEPLVADFELRLERDGQWSRFEKLAEQTLRQPWSAVKDKALAEEEFSLVMSVMYPERYTDPMSWFTSRGGTHTRSESPEEAVGALRDMLKFRKPGATLFLVVDEVSQYVLANKDRVDRLRAFATALGSTLKGRAWLVALGQQKLDEEADDSFLVWAKDRFPPKLRVHLASTNIRDVVHKRLLQKKPEHTPQLEQLFEKHRPDLKLYAYGCESVNVADFVDVYPMLPGQIDLILQITSALRTRSARAQGDDQAIRGLLQLLGELFRGQRLAEEPVGALVTLDQVYEVQHTALDSDVQDSMARVLSQCTAEKDALLVRAAKAVALLELIQDTVPTDAKLVAQCLYDRVDRGNQVSAVTEALEDLRRRNLLGYSEKLGYKVQSSAGEEWERDRRDIGVPGESLVEVIQEALRFLLEGPERPRLGGRPFPWAATFSDGRKADDVALIEPRDEAVMRVDFRLLSREESTESAWIARSADKGLDERLLWLAADGDNAREKARELQRSRAMIKKFKPRRESLNAARKLLLQQEENRAEDLEKMARDAVAAAWLAGKFYFQGRSMSAQEQGASFSTAVAAAATRVLPDLYRHFVPTQVQPSELLELTMAELSGLSTKFLPEELGIVELDSGRYVPACSGVVPRRVQEHIVAEGGLRGASLLAKFGGPPYGYTANVVKACVAGLLRAGKVRLQPESASEITAIRDAGARDLFEKDRPFRTATIFPAGDEDFGIQKLARICRFFEDALGARLDREPAPIADAVAQHFPQLAQQLRSVEAKLERLPGSPRGPAVFVHLSEALEQCIRICRQTKPTVKLVLKHLDVLRDGVHRLRLYDAELTDAAIRSVNEAHEVLVYRAAQLDELAIGAPNLEEAARRVRERLQSELPWQGSTELADDLQEIRAAYTTERQRLLQYQEQEAERARSRVKLRHGFSTLTADQAHQVLRPLSRAVTETTVEAIAPRLIDLKDPFSLALRRAEDQANDILDELLSAGDQPLIARVQLDLRNRELQTEADVEALLDEIRKRLLEQIRAGARVRLA